MDDCETYKCGEIRNSTCNSSRSVRYENDEFYPTDEEEILHRRDRAQGDHDEEDERQPGDGLRSKGRHEHYEGGGDEDHTDYSNIASNHLSREDQQRRLEKTVLHKAMIGIGPYLVEKAASVLGASRSYSGDLSYKQPKHKSQKNEEVKRKKSKLSGRNRPGAAAQQLQNHHHNTQQQRRPDEPKLCNSRSQSLTKGFHKLRLIGHGNRPHSNSKPFHHHHHHNHRNPSSGGSTSNFKIQRGFAVRKVNNKSSSTSSVGRKLPAPPPAAASRHPEGSVNQRLASAKRSMIRELKSRVTQLENQLKESQKENQILQRMQHRHEIALSKYEGAEAELPKMIRSHLAEVRTLQENLRKAHSLNRNIDDRMKSRDAKIFRLEEENKALLALVKQNNLEERGKLSKQLEQATADQMAAETRVADLQRHIEILEKNHRHQINVESKKLKNCNNKLFEAHQEIDKLYMALKEHERVLTCMRMRQGQSQIPGLRIPSIQIFRDDASIRSSRTLPAKKSAKGRPSDNGSLQENQLRRQHSDTFDSSRRDPETYSGRNKHHLFYTSYNYSDRSDSRANDDDDDRVCSSKTKVIHPRSNIPITKAIPLGQHTPTPLSPPSPTTSGRQTTQQLLQTGRTAENPQTSHTPIRSEQSQANFHMNRNKHAGGGDGDDSEHQTDLTTEDASEKSELGIDDEYYNFEDVSVEEDPNYHPHKSLFMDAVDSSCNVSSMGHSPLESMRSRDPSALNRNKHPRPSSAGPKYKASPATNPKQTLLSTQQETQNRHQPLILKSSECQPTTKPSIPTKDMKTFENKDSPPKALKRHADGETVKPSSVTPSASVRPETIMSLGAPNEFISQRSASIDENHSARQLNSIFTSSSESESEENSTRSSDYSKSGSATALSPTLTPKPGLPCMIQQKTGGDQDDKNYSIIESVFNRWKQNKSTPFEAPNTSQPSSRNKVETTPRRKEALLQKMKEIDATSRRKPEDATPLSNPAYFPIEYKQESAFSAAATTTAANGTDVKSSVTFKNTYQPFFNVSSNNNAEQSTEKSPMSRSVLSPNITAVSPGPKLKSSVLPWLQDRATSSRRSPEISQEQHDPPTESTIMMNAKDKIGLKGQHSSILEPRHTLPTNCVATTTNTEVGAIPPPPEQEQICSPRNLNIDKVSPSQQCSTAVPQQDVPRKKFTIASISSLQGNVQPSQIPSRIPKASRSRPSQPSWK